MPKGRVRMWGKVHLLSAATETHSSITKVKGSPHSKNQLNLLSHIIQYKLKTFPHPRLFEDPHNLHIFLLSLINPTK